MNDLQININRLMKDLDELSGIGSIGDGGVNRPALSEANLEARAWLKENIESSGLEFSEDPVGNHRRTDWAGGFTDY